jgi:hypothetical protein
MLRSSFASASKLAWLGLVIVGSAACAQGFGGQLLDDNGTTGSASGPTTSTTVGVGAGTGGAGSAGGFGGGGDVSSSSGVIQGVGGSFSSSGVGGGGTCDASGDCQTCGDCAVAGVCAPQMDACNADQDCVAFLDCISTCQDDTCANACATQYPDGTEAYETVVTCVFCQGCTDSCSAESGGACSP